MKPIIEVRNVWKRYNIGAKQGSYLSLRDSIVGLGKSIIGQKKETFWALQDINFDVMPGECLGIIGRNGAGKSTLLKVLSQITPPTKGHIKMRGRVASLLEVGTGFHPELTGRENIYLNGSILGMQRHEIKHSFDEIVAFSGIEKFLDTPLKHYSSGMRLKLAFSVAAHLNPEILFIDEVLAVGDAEFQKKCLDKMNEVSRSGRTVIFVSHDLVAVERLCQRSILLDNGQISTITNTQEAIKTYSTSIPSSRAKERVGGKGLSIQKIKFQTPPKERSHLFFDLEFTSSGAIEEELFIDLEIINQKGQCVAHLKHQFYSTNKGFNIKNQKHITLTYNITSSNLIAGNYNFTIYAYTKSYNELLWIEEFAPFSIKSSMSYNRLNSNTVPVFEIKMK